MVYNFEYIANAVNFAKEHFEHTTDTDVSCRYHTYTNEPFPGNKIKHEIVQIGKVKITGITAHTLDPIYEVHGGGERDEQIKEIDAVMLTYESCKPGLPASDRRSRRTIGQ